MRRFVGGGRGEGAPILPFHVGDVPQTLAGPLEYDSVFNTLVEGKLRQNGFQKLASRNRLAGLFMRPINYFTDHPIQIALLLWAVGFLVTYAVTSSNSSKDESGAEKIGEILTSALVPMAVSFVSCFVLSLGLNRLRKTPRRDVSGFGDYLRKIAGIRVGHQDIEFKRVITAPRADNARECESFFNWHAGFIRYLLRKAEANEEDVQDVWQAIEGITSNILEVFPMRFANIFVKGNWGFVENIDDDDVPQPSPDDLAISPPLLKLGEAEDRDQPLAIERDTFETASPAEREQAAKLDWKATRVIPKSVPVQPDNIGLRLVAYATELQSGTTASRQDAARVMAARLRTVLSDPLSAVDHGKDFKEEVAKQSYRLVNILRPAFFDGQMEQWRYFYAQDAVVTEAFKLLPAREQAHLIFVLMSGNDQGKLLALSILQDKRLPLTQFGSAEDRGLSTRIGDIYNNSSLSQFFDAYLREFVAIDHDKACDIYSGFYGGLVADEDVVRSFQVGLVNQARQQLVWLTRNDGGRMKALFEADHMIAARISFNFTVDVDTVPAEEAARSFAAPVESSEPRKAIQVVVPAAEAAGEPVPFEASPLPYDGSHGFSIFDEAVTRQEFADVLLEAVADNSLTFTLVTGAEPVQLTARQMVVAEIQQLFKDKQFRSMIPRKLMTESLSAVLSRMQQLEVADEKIKAIFRGIIDTRVPEGQRVTIRSFSQLLAYFQDASNDVVVEVGEAADEVRQQTAVRLTGLLQERSRHHEETDQSLQRACETDAVISAYISCGVAAHLPLGFRSAAVFAARKGHSVELYSAPREGAPLELQVRHKGSDEKLRVVIGSSWCKWALLNMPAVSEGAVAVPAAATTAAAASEAFAFDLGVAVRQPEPAHPYVTHGLSLLCSVKGEAWKRIEGLMKYGHTAFPFAGQLSSTRPLFNNITDPKNIVAIKEGVLQSRSLEMFLPMLLNTKTRDDVFELLAVLFSDKKHGIDFQRCFEKLVSDHREELCDDRVIGAYIAWLDSNAASNNAVDANVARIRFAAVIMLQTYNRANILAEDRSNRLRELLQGDNGFFPGQDLLSIVDQMRIAFVNPKEWEARRKIFRTVYLGRLQEFPDDVSGDLKLISADGTQTVVGVLVQGFAGNIRRDKETHSRVHSFGDLLTLIIIETYTGRTSYMHALIDQLCAVIQDPSTDIHTSENLTLVLMHAVYYTDTQVLPESKELEKYQKIKEIWEAYLTKVGRHDRPSSYDIPYEHFDRQLRLLNVTIMKAFSPERTESIYGDFETVLIGLACYTLMQPGIDADVRGRAQAYTSLYKAVAEFRSHQLIDLRDRRHFSRMLACFMPLNAAGYQEAELAMIRRVVFLLFLDPVGVDINVCLQNFPILCSSLGNGSVAQGLKLLNDQFYGDPLITDNYSNEQIERVRGRMTAIVLYSHAKKIPNRSRLPGRGDVSSYEAQRRAQAREMQSVLRTLGYFEDDVVSDGAINRIFNRSNLSNGFQDWGWGGSIGTVKSALKAYNHEQVRNLRAAQASSASSGGESDLLLGVDDAIEMRPSRDKTVYGSGSGGFGGFA